MKKYEDYKTAYCSTFRSHATAKHDKSDEHNFRLDKENSPNFDPDLSSKNITYIFNPQSNQVEKVDTPTPAHLQSIRAWQKLTFNSFKSAKVSKATKKQQDIDIQNSKRALNKFIENPKASEEERAFFEEVLQQLTGREPFQSSLVEYFKELTEGQKVSRYNDKIRRLETIQKINFQLEDRRSTNVKKQTEYLFKIPDDNEITLTDQEHLKIAKLMKEILPDNQILYFTIHHDENKKNPHLHIVFSNYNSKTNDFDLIDNERRAIKTFFELQKKTVPDFLNKNKKDFTEEELNKFGQLWQDLMYQVISRATENKYNFKRRPEKQVREDAHTYQQNLPITKREHNRQKKVKEKIEGMKADGQKLVSAKKHLIKEVETLNSKKEQVETEIEVKRSVSEKIQERLAAHTAHYYNGRFKPYRPRKWFELPLFYNRKRKEHFKKQLEERILKIENLQGSVLTEEQQKFFNLDNRSIEFAIQQANRTPEQIEEDLQTGYAAEVFENKDRFSKDFKPTVKAAKEIIELVNHEPEPEQKKKSSTRETISGLMAELKQTLKKGLDREVVLRRRNDFERRFSREVNSFFKAIEDLGVDERKQKIEIFEGIILSEIKSHGIENARFVAHDPITIYKKLKPKPKNN